MDAETSMKNLLGSLTCDLYHPILEYLRLCDQAQLSASSMTIRKHVIDYWSSMKSFNELSASIFSSSSEVLTGQSSLSPAAQLRYMINLREIDFSSSPESSVFELLQGDYILTVLGQHCKLLEVINLARSKSITNTGLQEIADGCPNLSFVDITFCPLTNYGSILILRGDPGPEVETFTPRSVVVRRQLPWQDGHFHCPWEPPEIHTYYPCGTFEFSREMESKGWVVRIHFFWPIFANFNQKPIC